MNGLQEYDSNTEQYTRKELVNKAQSIIDDLLQVFPEDQPLIIALNKFILVVNNTFDDEDIYSLSNIEVFLKNSVEEENKEQVLKALKEVTRDCTIVAVTDTKVIDSRIGMMADRARKYLQPLVPYTLLNYGEDLTKEEKALVKQLNKEEKQIVKVCMRAIHLAKSLKINLESQELSEQQKAQEIRKLHQIATAIMRQTEGLGPKSKLKEQISLAKKIERGIPVQNRPERKAA